MGVPILYALLAVALTWPLARHLATHVVLANFSAFGDPWIIGWSLAHESRVLAGLPHGGIFHPTPGSLFYNEAAFGALPIFIGPYLATGNPIVAINLVFLAGVVLTAWSMHAVVRRWTGSHAAGFVAGFTFLACPFSIWAWGPSAINYVTLWYWPWIVWRTSQDTRAARDMLALAALVVVQGLSSLYIAFDVLVPLGALATLALARPATRPASRRLLLAWAIAAVVLACVYSPYLAVRRAEPGLASQTLFPFRPSAAVASGLFAAGTPSGVAPAALAVVVLGAIAGLRGERRGAWRTALAWTAVGLALAVPARLALGTHAIETPLGWLADLGLPIHAVRDDDRRSLAALIGLSLLGGLGWAECAAWLRKRSRVAEALVAVVLIAGIYAGLLRAVPRRAAPAASPGRYPLLDAYAGRRIDSAVMAALRASDGALLELPNGPGPVAHADAMHRAMIHGHALVNGLASYWPADFPRRMGLACRLPDADALGELRRDTGVALILVHRSPGIGRPIGPYGCPPRAMGDDGPRDTTWDTTAWDAIARDGRRDLALVAADEEAMLFRVVP